MFFAVCGVIIAELLAGAFVHLSRAPQLRKFGSDVRVRPSVCSDSGGR